MSCRMDVSAIGGEDRDAVTAKRSNPDLCTNLDRDRARAKSLRRRFADDVTHGERLRVDLHDVRRLIRSSAPLPRREDRPICGPADVVDTETQRHFVAL